MPLPELLDHLKKTAALSQVAGLISWDQEAMMPKAGAAQRAEQAGALASVIHARNADPRIGEWVHGIDQSQLSDFDRRNVNEAKRSYDRATKIPPRLAEESARASSEGQRIWAQARAEKKFAGFVPALKRNIALKREAAACLAEDGADLYDCLLDEYEPGAKSADLFPLLESLRPPLVALREKIAGKAKPTPLTGHFPADQQLALAKRIAARIGYDFDAGRIDTVVHPFCSGNGGDVRITTRTDEADPLNCLYSTIHEVGHALYAQGAPDPYLPAADYCSMGVHESQSRFWENQIARSRLFADWLFPAMKEAFSDMNLDGPDALFAAVNRVETGFIRTEADEVHYNLHILLRFELERELIAGGLEAQDLEEAWNQRFERDFGIAVPDASLGVLQDVHWSLGLFGYFPTYSLGNIYAACLDRAMLKDLPGRDDMVRMAETQPILDWMREKIHIRGRVLSAPALIEEATGEKPTAAPLVSYLEAKFGALYDI
ncbi:carboxypeptidase M32 [Hoeflea prorocentri]|uniref:Metal-dependent carboxypeptidase n=1 Tax=Hoeflea prorocentri TaxID=1922333 RepID=A0A9X3ULC9_9HYPH|nr:carboxypeptidase M32 [Hoeflea prorocentri]MCY6383372.1 carboxypeptidase M32 [Hoeflea prorocentri]MDA5401172.1 carboxypeptidase M32 [Hoeflea prorocentri]